MWHLIFGRNHINVKRLPLPVQEHLKQRFMLRADYIDGLRYLEQDGAFHGEPVRQIRIYDADLAERCGIPVRTNSDLEQHPEVLLFIGHIDSQGQVYLADRRPPLITHSTRG